MNLSDKCSPKAASWGPLKLCNPILFVSTNCAPDSGDHLALAVRIGLNLSGQYQVYLMKD